MTKEENIARAKELVARNGDCRGIQNCSGCFLREFILKKVYSYCTHSTVYIEATKYLENQKFNKSIKSIWE